MSRVGKMPVLLPKTVKASLENGMLSVKGEKKELKIAINDNVKVSLTEDKIVVDPVSDEAVSRAMWGTTRALINNMVKGVSTGFNIRIEINGVGYRAAVDKGILSMSLGYSHEIKYVIPGDIEIKAEKPTLIVVSGADKQLVGKVASDLHRLRRVDPYKGKGVLYEGRKIRRKEGKKK